MLFLKRKERKKITEAIIDFDPSKEKKNIQF
jgi:hypothetical protein